MTTDVLNRKLDSLRNCLERIESKKPFDAAKIHTDLDLQDILSVNLERAVQVCVDIAAHILSEAGGPSPTTMAESFQQLADNGVLSKQTADGMIKAAGLRNFLVHEYSKIDWTIVADVCSTRLDTFRRFAGEVLANHKLKP